MKDKAKAMSEAGQLAELRSSNQKTSKPGFSFRFKTDHALGQFDVWITGEADFDIMDARTTNFAHQVSGMLLDDCTFESAFDEFITRMNCHSTPGKIVPESMRSTWLSGNALRSRNRNRSVGACVHVPCHEPCYSARSYGVTPGKQIVRRISSTRRYEALPSGLRAITALLVLRDKAIKPLLAAARKSPQPRRTEPATHRSHYLDLRRAMQGVFHELGIAA